MALAIINRFLNKGHERSIAAKKNILASFLFKGISVITMFALVPILIHQLTPQKYGIWLTLASFISWFTFFDVGLGNGLKNILTEKLAINDTPGAKKAISTAYFAISGLTLILLFTFLIGNQFLNWSVILNAPDEMQNELHILIIFVVISFFLQLILRLISSIYEAIQMSAVAGAITGIGNVITIILVCGIIFFTQSQSLVYYGIAISISPLVTLLIATIYFFKVKRPDLAPNYHSFDKTLVKSMFGLGGKFFLIQITAILLFQTNSFVIAHVVGSSAVTTYDVVFKYAGISQMIFAIVLTPIWVASADAYLKNNTEWIYNAIKKMTHLIYLLAIMSIFQLLFSKQFYLIWVGTNVSIDYTLTFLLLLYCILNMRATLHCLILNGIGKIKLQFIITLIESLVHIPLSIFLGKMWGINGVVVSMLIMISINAYIYPKQCKAILANRATGIWNE